MVHPSLDTMEMMEALFVSITSVGGSNMSSDQKGVSSSGNSGLGHQHNPFSKGGGGGGHHNPHHNSGGSVSMSNHPCLHGMYSHAVMATTTIRTDTLTGIRITHFHVHGSSPRPRRRRPRPPAQQRQQRNGRNDWNPARHSRNEIGSAGIRSLRRTFQTAPHQTGHHPGGRRQSLDQPPSARRRSSFSEHYLQVIVFHSFT